MEKVSRGIGKWELYGTAVTVQIVRGEDTTHTHAYTIIHKQSLSPSLFPISLLHTQSHTQNVRTNIHNHAIIHAHARTYTHKYIHTRTNTFLFTCFSHSATTTLGTLLRGVASSAGPPSLPHLDNSPRESCKICIAKLVCDRVRWEVAAGAAPERCKSDCTLAVFGRCEFDPAVLNADLELRCHHVLLRILIMQPASDPFPCITLRRNLQKLFQGIGEKKEEEGGLIHKYK